MVRLVSSRRVAFFFSAIPSPIALFCQIQYSDHLRHVREKIIVLLRGSEKGKNLYTTTQTSHHRSRKKRLILMSIFNRRQLCGTAAMNFIDPRATQAPPHTRVSVADIASLACDSISEAATSASTWRESNPQNKRLRT
ncbi:hypothetical protein BJ166DRAFT_231997 [Pestalotiopsis sp. NC0098]|nr:hypothetical protein BJ166DRAFT_231997 [Pestalotiopsis sp. NC0098]